MASEEKLSSFKVSALQKTTANVRSSKSAKSNQDSSPEKQESTSLGFKRIEGILENEPAEAVQHRLTTILGDLDSLEGQTSHLKDKNTLKKAKLAISHTLNMRNYLFQTRDELMQEATNANAPPQK